MLCYRNTEFIISAHSLKQLPSPDLPECAFAGRSNVGKSSLLNCLFERKNFVKVSGKPGKTQGLNYFSVDGAAYMVDLPGYGFAKVSKSMKNSWNQLIPKYLQGRSSLCCVVVIIDLRHAPKTQDRQLLEWLRAENIVALPVYTKADKLSGNQRNKNAVLLDTGLGVRAKERIIFSAQSGMGLEHLRESLESYIFPTVGTIGE